MEEEKEYLINFRKEKLNHSTSEYLGNKENANPKNEN